MAKTRRTVEESMVLQVPGVQVLPGASNDHEGAQGE